MDDAWADGGRPAAAQPGASSAAAVAGAGPGGGCGASAAVGTESDGVVPEMGDPEERAELSAKLLARLGAFDARVYALLPLEKLRELLAVGSGSGAAGRKQRGGRR